MIAWMVHRAWLPCTTLADTPLDAQPCTQDLGVAQLHRTLNEVPDCRDGTVHGCGSTEHGQLPYLRYSREGGSEGADEASMSAAELENLPARNEITIPTGLRLPVRQACFRP